MLGDPAIPADNTYQTILVIAGITYVSDAKNFDPSYGKAQYINDGLSKKNAKCRIRGAPNGAKYCLAYALEDFQSMKRWIRPMNGIIGQEFLNGQNFPKRTKLLRE